MSKVADNPGPVPPIPKEAIDYLQKKGLQPAFSYKDVWGEEHNHAFTVAKCMQSDLLSDIRESLTSAMAEGKTYRQWHNETEDMLSRRGWWGRKTVTDPKTGEQVDAQLGSSRRLKTIWDVNLGQAYQAGVWERGQKSTSHPYILYRLGESKEHRVQHVEWDGLILPKEHEFWDTHNPRNGWGCQCKTRFVSKAQYQRYLTNGIAAKVKGDARPGRIPVKTAAPKREAQTYVNKRTGKTYQGYAGVDPGFEHNPGTRRMEQLSGIYRDKDARFSRAVSPAGPAGTPVPDALNVRVRGDLADAARETLRAIASIHGDGTLPRIDVVRSKAQTYYGQFSWNYNGALKIRLAGGPHPAITAAHEVGHFLDHDGLPGRGFESINRSLPEMRRVIDSIKDTDTYRALAHIEDARSRTYLRGSEELWARTYSQYTVFKGGSRRMKDELDTILQSEYPGVRLQQWPHDEFVPIAQEIDRLFKRMGWLK